MGDPDMVRLAGPLQSDSIVDGEGLRATVFVQGCNRRCPGCHNPETWDFGDGFDMSVDEIKEWLSKQKGQNGVTFSGGEPMEQPHALKQIADFCRDELGWNVWSFSGYTYDELKALGGAKWDLVKSLDVLIDGPFVITEKDLTCRFRGSRNQRLLRLDKGEITSIE